MAIRGEFDGLDPLEFVSFNTIRTSFSVSADEGVGCAMEGKRGKFGGVDEPSLTVVETEEERVDRREETNGFCDVLILLVKGVEGK